MKISNLVLFKHTLRMDNANWHTYVVRLAMIVFMLLSILQIHTTSAFMPGVRAPGLSCFHSLTVINLLFICIYAISLSSSAITEEKEANAFSLLMMTGISPFTMLLSKSLGRLMSGLMLILAQFPFTVLAVTLGGISFKQVFATYILLISLMFLLNNLGLLISVVSKKSYTAATFTVIYLISYLAGIGLLSKYLELKGFVSLAHYLLPFNRLGEIFSTGFDGYIVDWNSAINILQGAMFFLLSCFLFNRFAWEEPENAPASLNLRHSKKPFLKFFKISRTWNQAISWKEFYFTVGGCHTIVGSFVVMSMIVTLVGSFEYMNSSEDGIKMLESISDLLICTGIIVSIVKLIYIASVIFSNDIWENTIQEIYTIPATLKDIILQKIKGAVLILIPSVTFVAIGLLLPIIILLSGHEVELPRIEASSIFLIFGVGAIHLIFFLYIVAYVSLRIKHGVIIVSAIVYAPISAIFCACAIIFLPFLIIPIQRRIKKKLLSLIENPGQ